MRAEGMREARVGEELVARPQMPGCEGGVCQAPHPPASPLALGQLS